MHLNQACQAKTPGRSIPKLSLHKAVYAGIMLCVNISGNDLFHTRL